MRTCLVPAKASTLPSRSNLWDCFHGSASSVRIGGWPKSGFGTWATRLAGMERSEIESFPSLHFLAAFSMAAAAFFIQSSRELPSSRNISVLPGVMIQLAGVAISGTIE